MVLHVPQGDPETRRGWASLTTVALAAALALTFAARPAAHDPITTKVTWSREIVRIVERRCTGCHVAGGVAPMPLGTYEQARPWLKAVKEEVVARRMPKWPAARGFGDFSNDRSLSPFEIELVAAWVDGGAPKGNARDLPPAASRTAPRTRVAGLTLTVPARTEPPAGERRTFDLATNLTRDRWMTSWRFQPNDAAILQAEFRLKDGTYLGHWLPPEEIVALPAGAGVRVPAHATMAVTLWYRSARAQQDFPVGRPSRSPSIGLFLGSAAPAREAHVLDAACGDSAAPDGEVFAIRPIAAQPGASVGVAVHPADGPPRPLAWLRAFDPDYAATFQLRDPLAMTRGSRIEVASADASCHAYVQYTTLR